MCSTQITQLHMAVLWATLLAVFSSVLTFSPGTYKTIWFRVPWAGRLLFHLAALSPSERCPFSFAYKLNACYEEAILTYPYPLQTHGLIYFLKAQVLMFHHLSAAKPLSYPSTKQRTWVLAQGPEAPGYGSYSNTNLFLVNLGKI